MVCAVNLKQMVQSRESFIQFVKFGLVGVSNTIIALAVYYALIWLDMNYLLANTISWIVSVFNAFYWNNRYVFKNEAYWLKSLFRTYVSYGASFLIGSALLYIFIEFCGISKNIAPLLTLVVSIPLNFLLNKFWTFR